MTSISSTCPYCNYYLNNTMDTHESPRDPMPGDASLCYNCGEFSWFDDQLQLVRMSAEESQEVTSDSPEHVRELQQLCRVKYLLNK